MTAPGAECSRSSGLATEMLDVFKTIIIFHFDIYYMQFIFVCSLVMCYSFMVVNILHNHTDTGAQDGDFAQYSAYSRGQSDESVQCSAVVWW